MTATEIALAELNAAILAYAQAESEVTRTTADAEPFIAALSRAQQARVDAKEGMACRIADYTRVVMEQAGA